MQESIIGSLFTGRYRWLDRTTGSIEPTIIGTAFVNAEARLLLANVRLLQGQPQQAVAVMKDYAPGAGSAYRAQAYGLLGGAYENMGRFREAGEAYENASAAARLDFMKAQFLADAGRAWTVAGDTPKAVAAFQRILKDYAKEGAATEAKVRLGELTKGTVS